MTSPETAHQGVADDGGPREHRGEPPVVFALRGYGRFVVAAAESGICAVERFANGELIARLGGGVDGRACVVVGSVAPPEARVGRLSLVAHTLLRAGASSVTALLPYLAYARQDAAAGGESLGLAWIGGLLRCSGVDDVVTVDVHSARAPDLLGLPLRSLSPAERLVAALPDEWLADATFVAPDEGAIARCRAVAAAAGRPDDVAHLVKRRARSGISHSAIHGDVGQRALVVDDILDTGATTVSCCRVLRTGGVRRIGLVVTHGLFTGTASRELRDAGIEEIWRTDSVLPRGRSPSAHLVPLAPLLAPITTDSGTRAV